MIATMILSAGLGSRLAPLSRWRAKPLVPVGDRPAIAHIVERVRPVSRVLVANAHHRAPDVERFAREAGLAISVEEELLGTGGGLRRAEALLGDGDVLVWNGDMLGELDVDALLAKHAAGGALATLVVAPRADAEGNTGIDEAGRVVRLRREPGAGGEVASADFLGIYVLGAELRQALPMSGGIIEETFLPALRAGGRVAAFPCTVPFVDIGTPRAYFEANLRWLGGRRAWRGEGAVVHAGAELERCVVGAGANVLGAGLLEACVVWPGAEARAPMRSAIVAPEGVVDVV